MPNLPGMEDSEVYFGEVDAPEIKAFQTTQDEDQDADPEVSESQHQRLVNLLGFDPNIEWDHD